jgi:hypothetical protein
MKRLTVTVFALLALAASAHAQQPQRFPTPNGNFVPGQVIMCLDSTGNAQPTSNGACSNQGVPLVVQQVNPLRVTHCKANPLTGITPPLC